LHAPLTISTDKNPDLPIHWICKDQLQMKNPHCQRNQPKQLEILANQNHWRQKREMASQALAPFKMKHLWRRRHEGYASYKICATIADEPKRTEFSFSTKHTPRPTCRRGFV
jgi:hypothetical protein